jgi:methylase of polypeptide subunit release factors
VHNSCFFKGAAATDATWLISNPPYIPAEDDSILMPALHGGRDGANLTRVSYKRLI